MCRLGLTPSVMTRVRYPCNGAGVLRVVRCGNRRLTRLGRPRSRLSRITSSKKCRPWTGLSKTWVRLTSTCQSESLCLKPAARSFDVNGQGSCVDQRLKNRCTSSGPSWSQICCSFSGWRHDKNPLSRLSNRIRSLWSRCLTHSWPFRHSLRSEEHTSELQSPMYLV